MVERSGLELQLELRGISRGQFRAMASPCELLVDGCADIETLRQLTTIAADEAWRVEQHWSRYRGDGVVQRINRADGQSVTVDDETARLLDYAAQLFAWSEGRFDITSGALRRAWHFDGSDRLPTAETIAALLPRVGWQRVQWQSPVLQMPVGMEIDFGGLGKEYAVDRALNLLRAATPLPVLVNFGGDLAASGPRCDGSAWQVGIEAPGQAAPPVVALHRGAIASSGDAHRYLLKDGLRYCHVLDPRTGWAISGAPRTVTVFANTCTEAGVLATLALLHGAEAEAQKRRRRIVHRPELPGAVVVLVGQEV